MLLIIVINVLVISFAFDVLDSLDDKRAKAVNEFCKLECK